MAQSSPHRGRLAGLLCPGSHTGLDTRLGSMLGHEPQQPPSHPEGVECPGPVIPSHSCLLSSPHLSFSSSPLASFFLFSLPGLLFLELSGILEAQLLPQQTSKLWWEVGGWHRDSHALHRARSCPASPRHLLPGPCPSLGDPSALPPSPTRTDGRNSHPPPAPSGPLLPGGVLPSVKPRTSNPPSTGVHRHRTQTLRQRRCRWWASSTLSSIHITTLHGLRLKLRGHRPPSSQSGGGQTRTQISMVPPGRGRISPGETG